MIVPKYLAFLFYLVLQSPKKMRRQKTRARLPVLLKQVPQISIHSSEVTPNCCGENSFTELFLAK